MKPSSFQNAEGRFLGQTIVEIAVAPVTLLPGAIFSIFEGVLEKGGLKEENKDVTPEQKISRGMNGVAVCGAVALCWTGAVCLVQTVAKAYFHNHCQD